MSYEEIIINEYVEQYKIFMESEKQLIENRVINAAKEYINDYDSSFYENLVHVGDISYIDKANLIKSGLINEKEVSELGNFQIKCELLENDKLKFTIEY